LFTFARKKQKRMRKLIILVTAIFLSVPSVLVAKDTPNSRQARKIFEEVYQKTFGPQGCTLHYAVNIIGIYKTEGTIWYKGNKSKFVDERFSAFNDGVNHYLVERKKKTVHIHKATSEKRDKYATKFVFEKENFDYQIEDNRQGLLLTLKAKPHTKGIKLIKVLLEKGTHTPLSLRIKLGIFSTTIKVSDYKSGNIADALFVFPKEKYKSYQNIDHRGEE